MLANLDKLINIKLRSTVNDSCKSCVHIFRWSKLSNLSQPSINLVTHCRNNVVDRDLVFFIDQCFSPDLSIDFIARFQMLADVIFFLCNCCQLFATVDVHPCLRLAEQGSTKSGTGLETRDRISYHFILSNFCPILDILIEFIIIHTQQNYL